MELIFSIHLRYSQSHHRFDTLFFLSHIGGNMLNTKKNAVYSISAKFTEKKQSQVIAILDLIKFLASKLFRHIILTDLI